MYSMRLVRYRMPALLSRFSSSISSPRYNETIDTKTLFAGSGINQLIGNRSLRQRYVELLRKHDSMSEKDRTSVFATIDTLVDTACGYPEPEMIDLIFNLWEAIYAKPAVGEIAQLQKSLGGIRDKMTHLCINTRNYHLYEQHLRRGFQPSWADRLAQTFQMRYRGSSVVVNRSSIVAHLCDDTIDLGKRRAMLAQLIHAGVLNTCDVEERFYFYELFVEMAAHLGDSHFEFLAPEYNVYTRIVRLMGTPYKMPFIQHTERIGALFGEEQFSNFLTSAMDKLHKTNPNAALNLWKYKLDTLEKSSSTRYRDVLHYHDLSSAMSALCGLQLHKEAIVLYSNYPDIHNEDQIEVMLRISEETKNWSLLQSQFEDMYGRGQLPYVEHYVVVMRALSATGHREQVDSLYAQMQKRKLQPNALIFAALIRSRLHENDFDAAIKCFEEAIKVCGSHTAHLYSLMFHAHIQRGDLDSTMDFLRQAAAEQVQRGVRLVSSSTMAHLVKFAARNYGLKEIEEMAQIAKQCNATGCKTYIALAHAYTSLDQHDRADKMVYRGHLESPVPFTNPDCYAAQLRNYAKWAQNSPKGSLKRFVQTKARFIVDMFSVHDNGVVSKYGGSPAIYAQIIKHHLAHRNVEQASQVLSSAKQAGQLAEDHFLPIFAYLTQQATYDSYTEILTLYRRMATERVAASTRTYVYMMEALNFLDQHQHTKGVNSTKLLASVMQMNGLSLDGVPVEKTSAPLAMSASIDLCKIISTYVESYSNESHTQLLVNFFDQIKHMLDLRHSHRFRFTVYTEISKIYRLQRHKALARQLLLAGIADLRKVADSYALNYPFDETPVMPSSMSMVYRRLHTQLFHLSSSTRRALDSANTDLMTLTGSQYNKIINDVFRNHVDNEAFLKAMNIAEDHLVAGNWVEVRIMRVLQQAYLLVYEHLCRMSGPKRAENQYSLLNSYYNVHNQPFPKSASPAKARLAELLHREKAVIHATNWTVDDILEDIPRFFNPERRTRTTNKLLPKNCSALWWGMHRYANNDLDRAFALMDRFPQTVEFLMYNDAARIRKKIFVKEVDLVIPPRENESYEERVDRTAEVLKMLSERYL